MAKREQRNKGLGSGSLGHSKHRLAAAPRGRLKSPKLVYFLRIMGEMVAKPPEKERKRETAKVRAEKWLAKRKKK